jgi:hypothetical protein
MGVPINLRGSRGAGTLKVGLGGTMKYAWLIDEMERRERELQRERQRPQIPLYIEDARFYERPERKPEPRKETSRVIEIEL